MFRNEKRRHQVRSILIFAMLVLIGCGPDIELDLSNVHLDAGVDSGYPEHFTDALPFQLAHEIPILDASVHDAGQVAQ